VKDRKPPNFYVDARPVHSKIFRSDRWVDIPSLVAGVDYGAGSDETVTILVRAPRPADRVVFDASLFEATTCIFDPTNSECLSCGKQYEDHRSTEACPEFVARHREGP
jgi:hypothetical protein